MFDCCCIFLSFVLMSVWKYCIPDIPSFMAAMMSGGSEFQRHAHLIHKCFGVGGFLCLEPCPSEFGNAVSESHTQEGSDPRISLT